MNLYFPIFDTLGAPSVSLDMIFNPIYPDHIKWRCKASRKSFKKKRVL